MESTPSQPFLSGVIEGFYGKPWSTEERLELFDWMAGAGLNTYLYGPKDDLRHRAIWRECYPDTEARELTELIRTCHGRGFEFFYALGPGLDIRFSAAGDRESLKVRFGQLIEMGCRHFCLLFDDIPDVMDPADRARFGTFASAQASVANELFRWVRERLPESRFLFCPTPYCGRMAERQLGGPDYLATIGRELLPDIGVFWTGPEIISREITLEHLQWLTGLLRRKPVLWDNLHANDYDGHRFYCGPYSGRPLEIRQAVDGILTNPNTEFAVNYVAVRTLGDFLRCEGTWDPRLAYCAALREWGGRFETAGGPIPSDDLTLLLDSYYLPYELGETAEAFRLLARRLLSTHPAGWGTDRGAFLETAGRLRRCCARIAEVKHRPLFHAMSRRVWELREELDLLEKFVVFRSDLANAERPFHSDFHLPQTYRGGLVAELQRLLVPRPDGSFVARRAPGDAGHGGGHSS
jgi:protein O-GlcNAcase/histone acetyltransferase